MRRVIAAVGLGVVVGLLTTLVVWRERDGAERGASRGQAEASAAATAPGDEALPRVEDRARPGLWVTVQDAGRGVAGARVEAWRQLPDEAKGGVRWLPLGVERTDATGRATFPAVRGRHVVRAAAGGRTGLAVLDVVVAEEPTAAVVTLGLSRPIAGRVVDEATQAPVPGALVTAVALSGPGSLDRPWRFPAETHVTTQADGLGRFRVDVDPSLEIELHAYARGYAHIEAQSFARDERADDVTVELQRAAVVDGVVVDASGQPIAGATVRSEPPESAPVRSDEAGRFALPLAPGAATLHAVSPAGVQGLARVRAAPGEALTGTRVVCAAAGDLVGRVVDSEGAGVSGVEVRVLAEPDSAEVATVQTDARGAFTAVQLPAARYSLFARSGDGARARQVSVEVPTTGPVELRLAAAAGLAGQVVNEAGHPLANAHVEVEWATGLGEPAVHARSDADGRFELGDLLPGMVTAAAHLGDARSEDAEVYLSAGQTASARLTLVRRGHVKGRVLAAKPERFYVFPQQAGVDDVWKRGFRTDDQGRFDEALPPGRYALVTTRSMAALPRADAGVPVEVLAGETTLVELPSPPEGEDDEVFDQGLHPEVGSGLSFEAGPGGLTVSFVMQGCPAAVAGVRAGDLVLRIDGEPVTQSLDAFQRLNRPRGQAIALTLRREGRDLELTLK